MKVGVVMSGFAVVACATNAFAGTVRREVKVEKVAYLGMPNCFKLSNGAVEVVVTTDVGPRIIRYSFPGEENILAEMPDTIVKTALGDWKPVGGHRLYLRFEDGVQGEAVAMRSALPKSG